MSLLTVLEMSATTRATLPRYAMPCTQVGASVEGQTMRFTTRNTFEALNAAGARSDDSHRAIRRHRSATVVVVCLLRLLGDLLVLCYRHCSTA
jgi:hypothetical protein